jgi:hypothetical protein
MSADGPRRNLDGMNYTVSTIPALAFFGGPWLLLGLALSGPFLALLLVFAAASVVPALLVLPLLAVRRLRRRHQAPSFELQPATA